MAQQLSKLHVRFIQTQERFTLQRQANAKKETSSLETLYIKNSSHFYYINTTSTPLDAKEIFLTFSEKNDYLSKLECACDVSSIEQGSDDYEEGLLFFQQDQNEIKQLLLLTLKAIKEK